MENIRMTKEQTTIITERDGVNFKTNLKETAKEIAMWSTQDTNQSAKEKEKS